MLTLLLARSVSPLLCLTLVVWLVAIALVAGVLL